MMAEISGLKSSTNYSIAVAAVNGAGTGDYSDPYIIITDSETVNSEPSCQSV